MTIDITALQKLLCNTFCQDVRVNMPEGQVVIALPMSARDGDQIMAYLGQTTAGWRISDMGTTMMKLSYENDLSRLFSGARGQLLQTILNEGGLSEDDGEVYVEVPADVLLRGLFTFGQGLTRIEDIGLWTRTRIESTFHDDLRAILNSFLSAAILEEGYLVPEIPNGESYPVDYYIHTTGRPPYVFGVNTKEKAMLATIILQHLQKTGHRFDSMVICSNIEEIPKSDKRRLLNAANDVVATIHDTDAIKQKIQHRLSA